VTRGPCDFNVLIIDDQRGPREMLHLVLRPTCRVFVAQTADAALTILQEEAIHLVIQDVGLPDKCGNALLREIRGLRPKVSVIMITGMETTESEDCAREQGALAYLLKPFDLPEFMHYVEYARSQAHVDIAGVDDFQ
jgi:DNA-binding response OmpR family regulator